MITSGEVLAKNGFGFIEIVTQNGRVIVNDAFGPHDFDRARIPFRQWLNVGNQLRLVQVATFFVRKNAIVGEIFLPGFLIANYYCVEKFLGATNNFLLRYRYGITAK